jgi:hypothetical protein
MSVVVVVVVVVGWSELRTHVNTVITGGGGGRPWREQWLYISGGFNIHD